MSDDLPLTLGSFLRTKRSQISPEVVGWPAAKQTRRRVQGLRREEVAQLAGISVTWYTLLEQDRAKSLPSMQVLQHLARVLHLSLAEREHLFDLAHPRLSVPIDQMDSFTPALQRVLDQQPSPAYIVNRYWDIVAWNHVACRVFVDYPTLMHCERNVVYQYFINPVFQGILVNWEQHAQSLLGPLRVDYVRHRTDPTFIALIERFCHTSVEFNVWWSQHDIQPCGPLPTIVQHPVMGQLVLEQTVYRVEKSAGLRLVMYTPLDQLTDERLGMLQQ